MRLGRMLHLACAGILIYALTLQAGMYPEFEWLSLLAGLVFLSCLIYQHSLVKPGDLSRVNLAFFTTNGVASVVYGALTIVDIYV